MGLKAKNWLIISAQPMCKIKEKMLVPHKKIDENGKNSNFGTLKLKL